MPDFQRNCSGNFQEEFLIDMVVSGMRVLGECDSWVNSMGDFLISVLSKKLVGLSFVSIHVNYTGYIEYDGLEKMNYDLFSCQNTSDVARFVMGKGINDTGSCTEDTDSALAAPRALLLKRCGVGVIAVCIDCSDPCADSTLSACDNMHLLSPCASVTEKETNPCPLDLSFIKMLVTRFDTSGNWPLPVVNTSYVTQSTQSSLAARVYVDNDGYLVCALLLSGGSDVISNYLIKSVGILKETNSHMVDFTFSNLIGSTRYTMYCLAKSYDGQESTMADMLETKKEFETKCCKKINIKLLSKSFELNTVMPAVAISVSIEARPQKPLRLLLGVNPPLNNAFVPSTIMFGSGASLYYDNIVFNPKAFENATDLLSYYLNITILSEDALDYDVNFLTYNSFRTVSGQEEPSPPVLTRALFSDDLTRILLIFDAATDRGAMFASTFVCSKLFYFWNCPKCAEPGCYWIDDMTAAIKLGGSTSLNIGSEVTVKVAAMKSQCKFIVGKPCRDWRYVSEKTVLRTNIRTFACVFF